MKTKDPDLDTLSIPDIRNKLSPIKNLIALLEYNMNKDNLILPPYIIKEIKICKESIAYLSGNKK